MTKIEIINGTYGHRPEGSKHPVSIDRGGFCEVPDEEAQRLYRLGVARPVQESTATAVATPAEGAEDGGASVTLPADENGAEGEETAHLDAEQLKELTNAKLRELAEEMGIDTAKLKTKAQLIAAITDVPLEDAISEEDDGEQPPELGVEGPVV